MMLITSVVTQSAPIAHRAVGTPYHFNTTAPASLWLHATQLNFGGAA
jgi:hypothetical protein